MNEMEEDRNTEEQLRRQDDNVHEEEEETACASSSDDGRRHMWSVGCLCDIVEVTPVSVMQPVKYFFTWQGVLTIAYSGIPPSLLQLKKRIKEEFPGIRNESAGSLWPITSLACLHDRRYPSLSQLYELHHICSEESSSLVVSPYVLLNNLSVVLYGNCCLEKNMLVTRIPLSYPADFTGPPLEESTYVAKVLNDFKAENLENYLAHFSEDGYHSAHYKNSRSGVSLVHFIATPPPSLARFRQRVESALPGLYDWFSESSLHITIRPLV
ncbi:hypothetical protein O6H91_07G070300 [Diphasiastrum complanatum]|uniref:Uncharacterized protein n=1 Tax=Diphasiastrum complanatum TaxID=34168 RepID=A0ACC2D6G1_DIPCM|nr:hypothetical protein O6H91_07G070300 [Diphasiastrum complanatum]